MGRDTTGFAGELVVQRTHSINYDQSWCLAGGRLVFAGGPDGCTLQAKPPPRTAEHTHTGPSQHGAD